MNNGRAIIVARAAVIAALYASLALLFQPVSYGPIQVRVSEALAITPIFFPEAIPGLFIGCLIANFFGGLGIFDVVFGSIFTLIAALLTYFFRNKVILAFISPVVVNGLGVPLYLSFLFKMPYWLTVAYVTAGQALAVFGLGSLLYVALKRSKTA